jgi:hypothetical protein
MKLKQAQEIQEVAGEKMIMAQDREVTGLSNMISPNNTAEWLWQTIGDREFSAESAVEILMDEFEVDRDQAMNDVRTWVDSMLKAGLIER